MNFVLDLSIPNALWKSHTNIIKNKYQNYRVGETRMKTSQVMQQWIIRKLVNDLSFVGRG